MTTESPTTEIAPTQSRPRPARSVLIAQAAFLLLGLYVLYGSLELGLWTTLGPGAGLFPFAMGVVLTLMSLIWVVQEQRAPSTPREEVELSHVAAVIGSLLVLAAVLPFLGFQVALLLFLMYHLRIRARLGWVKSLIISVAGSVGVFYLFTLGLKVSLPVASVPPFSLIGL